MNFKYCRQTIEINLNNGSAYLLKKNINDPVASSNSPYQLKVQFIYKNISNICPSQLLSCNFNKLNETPPKVQLSSHFLLTVYKPQEVE